MEFLNIFPPISKKLIFSARKQNLKKSSLLFWNWASSGSNHVKSLALALPKKPVLGLQALFDAFESIPLVVPLKIRFEIDSLESCLPWLSFRRWIRKALSWTPKVKCEKNYDHFTETLRFWKFLDPLSIFQISQRGKSSDSLGNDIRDQQHIIYRMLYEKSGKKIHCKLAQGHCWVRNDFLKNLNLTEIEQNL